MRRVSALLVLLAACALAAPAAEAGFAPGECTTWAFLMRPEIVVDTTLAAGSLNWNADQWAVNAAKGGFRVGTTPAVGAIVVWPAHVDGAGAVGHVAYVEQVSANGFYISEENYAGSPSVHRRWITQVASSVRFIYLKPGEQLPSAPLADGSLNAVSSTGTFSAASASATAVTFQFGAATVVALKLTGPSVNRTVTWTFKPGSWQVTLAQIAGAGSLAPGAYVLEVVPYSTNFAWNSLSFKLA